MQRKHTPAVDLRKPRDPGLYVELAHVRRPVIANVLRNIRPWSHQRHVTAENVDKIRQLIEACTPQPAPDTGKPRISAQRQVALGAVGDAVAADQYLDREFL